MNKNSKFFAAVAAGFLILVAIVFYLISEEIGEDEVYILPKGFKGAVTIIMNREDGEEEKYENGKRVYEIPANGVLITQFGTNPGWHSPTEFFHKSGSELVEVPYALFSDNLDPEAVRVCCVSNGTAWKNEGDVKVEFIQLYVGTESEITNIPEDKKPFPANLVN
jgi:hypothetical protein